jgi:hypothetical protein
MDQLTYLNPEPDRWRGADLPELNRAFSYDHYVNLERLNPGALDAPDRWAYLNALGRGGIDRPERVGLLPYRIVELHQRLTRGFELWRQASDRERPWIEDRIVNDAGILGHYVTDASNPHHTTVHHDGWVEDAPNPRGFSTRSGFHRRFESDFVDVAVRFDDVRSRMSSDPPPVVTDVRSAVLGHIMGSHRELERLYELDQDPGFDPDRSPHPDARGFTLERLVAGAEMLRTLWWSAWVESAG